MNHHLTLGSCLKGEESYIKDFIKFHRNVGVEHFVFLSREESLADFLKKEKDVEVRYYPEGEGRVHAQAWADLVHYNRGKTKWLALIDADEALVPVKTDSVPEILRDYEEFACLQINWNVFGSGGATTRTKGSVYERFTKRASWDERVNIHTQFICQPDRTLAETTDDPHHPKLAPHEVSVNTNKIIVPNVPFSEPILSDVLWCAHYINKSREEWEIKNAKGRCDIAGAMMPEHVWDDIERIGNAEDEFRVRELFKKKARRK